MPYLYSSIYYSRTNLSAEISWSWQIKLLFKLTFRSSLLQNIMITNIYQKGTARGLSAGQAGQWEGPGRSLVGPSMGQIPKISGEKYQHWYVVEWMEVCWAGQLDSVCPGRSLVCPGVGQMLSTIKKFLDVLLADITIRHSQGSGYLPGWTVGGSWKEPWGPRKGSSFSVPYKCQEIVCLLTLL